jgi:uncharacterized protein
MKQLKKIDAQTNVITWFEIPVNDTERAKKFYETIFDIEMVTKQIPQTGEELTFFPFDPNIIQATTGRVTGVLSKTLQSKPSDKGTLVYLNAYPEIQKVLDKVEIAGGKTIIPRTQMNFGSIAVIIDTEGNRVGLHSES